MDIETIIYLIFLILSIVFSAVQSNKKKRKKKQEESYSNEQDTIGDQWKEFLGVTEEAPQPESPESTYESYDDEYEDIEEEAEVVEETTGRDSFYNYDIINQQKDIQEKLKKAEELKKKSLAQKEKVMGGIKPVKKHHKPAFKFDPVKAVIYSEILKRPEY